MSKLKGKILIVDDDKFFCDIKSAFLQKNDFETETLNSAGQVLDTLKSAFFDLVLLDLKIGEENGIEVLQGIKKFDPETPVIMITGFEDVATAVEAIQEGAYDYLKKKITNEELLIKIDRAIEKHKDAVEIRTLKDALNEHYGFSNIVGANKHMKEVYELIKTVCDTDATILINGETGSGKELIAKAVHFNSQRKDKPFVAVNCAAISEHLMESELFGHEKGAFTGAHQQRKGKAEIAHGGTLFLDEIGDMSLNLQAKLLRFLQDKSFERVGGNDTLTSDTRVITATNKNLPQMIQDNAFREDLYYRINMMRVELPPLRSRLDDLPLLADHFIKRANIKYGKQVKSLSNETLEKLKEYPWPGNVRELENVISRLVLTSKKNLISAQEISGFLQAQETPAQEDLPSVDVPLREAREDFEKWYLKELLRKYHGNIKMVSEKSEMQRKSIFLKMAKFGLKKEDFKKLP